MRGNGMKKRLFALVTALGLAAAAPAVAQGPVLNLTISKPNGGPEGTTTTVLFGELVRVSGELSNGQPNQSVQLTVTPYRGTPRIINRTTDSNGEFEYVHRPNIRTSYTARWSNRTSADEPFAHVRPKVGLRVFSRSSFRVTMAAVPQHVSRIVFFQRRLTASRWATVRRVQLRGRNLSARFRARLPRGTQRVRIVVPQTPGYLRATSRFVLVR
jgi:hypothetical protein